MAIRPARIRGAPRRSPRPIFSPHLLALARSLGIPGFPRIPLASHSPASRRARRRETLRFLIRRSCWPSATR
eukprot:scaffold6638_cov76-Phaeocystis_antarctica.AAC.2